MYLQLYHVWNILLIWNETGAAALDTSSSNWYLFFPLHGGSSRFRREEIGYLARIARGSGPKEGKKEYAEPCHCQRLPNTQLGNVFQLRFCVQHRLAGPQLGLLVCTHPSQRVWALFDWLGKGDFWTLGTYICLPNSVIGLNILR